MRNVAESVARFSIFRIFPLPRWKLSKNKFKPQPRLDFPAWTEAQMSVVSDSFFLHSHYDSEPHVSNNHAFQFLLLTPVISATLREAEVCNNSSLTPIVYGLPPIFRAAAALFLDSVTQIDWTNHKVLIVFLAEALWCHEWGNTAGRKKTGLFAANRGYFGNQGIQCFYL